jgi:hypothetical protein
MDELNVVRVKVSGQPIRCGAVEYSGSFRLRFTAIDIRHRGTIDDNV